MAENVTALTQARADVMSFGVPPELNSGMTFREIGNSGLRAFAGWVREEFLPQLIGRQGARVYREMMDNSPVIGGLMYAIQSTMRKVEWRTEAADDSPEAEEMKDFADSLRDDMSHTWEDFINESLSMLGYGYAPMEIVYKLRNGRRPKGDAAGSVHDDGLIGWRRMPLRGQDTVIKWFFDGNGSILGVTQQPYVGPLIDIPMEKMILFRPGQHKNNPEGRSILRNSYRSYYFVKRIEEQEAIMFERFNGIPIIRVPQALMDKALSGDAQSKAAIARFQSIAVNLRIDEQMGVVLPSDTIMGPNGPSAIYTYSIELLTPGSHGSSGGSGKSGGGGADTTLTRHQTNIMISVLADFLALGHDSRGTQALAVSKTDLFFQAIEGYLNGMAGTFNRYALPRVWALNGFDDDLTPKFVPDLAARLDLDVLSNFVLRLSQAGMPLFPNPDVETALLDAAGLPDVDQATALQDLGLDPTKPPQADAPPHPDDGKPDMQQTKVGKVIMASLAKRMNRFALHGVNIRTKPVRKRVTKARLAKSFNPDQPRDDHGQWTSGGDGGAQQGDDGGGRSATPASDLYRSSGGGQMTAGDIIAASGAGDRVAAVEERLKTAIPTDAPVSQGGFKNPDGTWTDERIAIHQEILGRMFTPEAIAAATPGDGQKPTLTVLGGRGGSGKSFITSDNGPVDRSASILIDSDAIKAALPEYQGWNAAMVHEEATAVVDEADTLATKLNVSVIHDATMKSEGTITQRVARYVSQGYDVHGYYVYAAPETAATRAIGRFMRGGDTGRYVPVSVILGNTKNEANFDKLIPSFSKWAVYDNNAAGGKSPRLVASG